MECSTNRGQQGAVMVTVLVIVLLLGLVGGTMVALSATELATGNEFQKGVAAQYLAEAGALRAIVKLKSDELFIAQTANAAGYTLTGTIQAVGSYTTRVTGNGANRTIVATGAVGNGKASRRQVVIRGRMIPNASEGLSQVFLPEYWTNVPAL